MKHYEYDQCFFVVHVDRCQFHFLLYNNRLNSFLRIDFVRICPCNLLIFFQNPLTNVELLQICWILFCFPDFFYFLYLNFLLASSFLLILRKLLFFSSEETHLQLLRTNKSNQEKTILFHNCFISLFY